jgi:hypothetical protein
VARTKTGNLPVHTDVRNGRTRVLTTVSRVAGDAAGLAAAVRGAVPEGVRVEVSRAGRVVVHGRYVETCKRLLVEQGF